MKIQQIKNHRFLSWTLPDSVNENFQQLKISNKNIFFFPECLQENSFDQLCINFINEKAQNFTINRLMDSEIRYHHTQNLEMPQIDYLDNEPILSKLMIKS